MSRRNNKRDRSASPSSASEDEDHNIRNRNDMSRGSSSRDDKKKIYVSNIAFDTTYQELKEEFSSVGEVTFVQMVRDSNKRFKGCAVITFKEAEMATTAIDSMNRRKFKGRNLVVKEEAANPEKNKKPRGRDGIKRSKDDRHDMGRAGSTSALSSLSSSSLSRSMNYNTYGLSMAFLDSINVELPLVNRVFVANLDYSVDEELLKEVFLLAGNVLECEIFKDKEGKSRGFGVVEYEHPVEAVQAISMLHNQSYRDRLLSVRLDRSEKKKNDPFSSRLPLGLKSVGMGLGVDGKPLKDIKSGSENYLPAANPLSAMTAMASSNPSLGMGLGGSLANTSMGLMDAISSPLSGGLAGNRSLGTLGMGSALGGGGFGSSRDYGQGGGGSFGSGLGTIVHISNLPLDFTSENLRELCWSCGDVRLAEMRSPGIATIRFRTETDAQRCVELLDHQPVEGRLISARVL